jgi:cystathionine gamma-synthase
MALAAPWLAAVGQPVPDTPHAVSVSLPSWKANVGYEEGEDWVLSKLKTGYPRFFIHLTIQELQNEILSKHGKSGEGAMLFPSTRTAKICYDFLLEHATGYTEKDFRILELAPSAFAIKQAVETQTTLSGVHCVFYPSDCFHIAKEVWQHSGNGISSRRAEFCLKAFHDGLLEPADATTNQNSVGPHMNGHLTEQSYSKGPRRYQKIGSQNGIVHNINLQTPPRTPETLESQGNSKDYTQFIEERFGRNLSVRLAKSAKLAIRKRIAGCLIDDADLEEALQKLDCTITRRSNDVTEEDVYLYPAGMCSIFNTHRLLLAAAPSPLKSICFGFPYIDTLKILQKWGLGCQFYGNGSEADLDDLESRLEGGERFLALFTEFPGNPLLLSPNLRRIRQLADKYDFAVVVDETVGNFININVLRCADIVVSSLTKVFSGDSNVMGGSMILNPHGPKYSDLKQVQGQTYEDNYWAEDAVFMERNSRDFVHRIERINENAEAIAARLAESPLVKQVYYPKTSPTRANYDEFRNPNGGYGGLLSVTLKKSEHAVTFFDSLEVEKGPSLGTNFTLSCPYVILAHYTELEWASQFGVEQDLVRISVGLEKQQTLIAKIDRALEAVANSIKN